MKYQTNKAGYSLVEVLVAITVLLVSIVGPLTIAASGLKNASQAKQQNIAFFLAQEGLESVVKLREEGGVQTFISTGITTGSTVWNNVQALNNIGCTETTPCGVDVNNNFTFFKCSSGTCKLYLHPTGRTRYNHNISGGTETPYTRQIVISVDGTRAFVKSTVTWGAANDQKLELATYIYNIYGN